MLNPLLVLSHSVFLWSRDAVEFVRSNGLRGSKSVLVWPRQKERKTITHRDAGQSGSPSTVTVFSLWCKDILELLGPTAAVYHAASSSSLALYVTVAIISTVHPPMACCGLFHEYISLLFLIHVHIIVLHKDKLYGVGGANVRVGGGTKCPGWEYGHRWTEDIQRWDTDL